MSPFDKPVKLSGKIFASKIDLPASAQSIELHFTDAAYEIGKWFTAFGSAIALALVSIGVRAPSTGKRRDAPSAPERVSLLSTE